MAAAARPPTADERATMPSRLDAGDLMLTGGSLCRRYQSVMSLLEGHPIRDFEDDGFCDEPDPALLVFARDAPVVLSWLGWLLLLAAPIAGFALARARGSPSTADRRITVGTGVVMLLGAASAALLLSTLSLATRLRGVPGGEPWDELADVTLRIAFLAGLCTVAGAALGKLANATPPALLVPLGVALVLLVVPAAVLPVESTSFDEPDRPPLYALYLWGRDELDVLTALLLLSLTAHLLAFIRARDAVRLAPPAVDAP